MNKQLHIPSKLKVGFNERSDTYSKQLGFITYYLEGKEETKHKASWENWRDQKIPVKEFNNTPREGFILNRNVGGRYGSWSSNGREPKIRVWDPEGFEIEITLENMLFVLSISGSYPGKGLEGEFIYAFDGASLVLLPTASEEYKNSVEFTSLKEMGVKATDLIVGGTYYTKSQQTYIYLGKYVYVHNLDSYYSTSVKTAEEHIFTDGTNFLPLAPKDLAKEISSDVASNLAELVEQFQKRGRIFDPSRVKIEQQKQTCPRFSNKINDRYDRYSNEEKELWIKKDDNTYEQVRFDHEWTKETGKGIRMKYLKKLILSPDGIAVKKSSKKDTKIYPVSEIAEKEFFQITLDYTDVVSADIHKRYEEYRSNRNDRYGQENYSVEKAEAQVKQYGIKEIE